MLDVSFYLSDSNRIKLLKSNFYKNVIKEEKVSQISTQVLDENQIDTSAVCVFTNVKSKNVKNGKEVTYKLVSESEANIKAKKISVNSPVGKGLLGKKVGEIATVITPRGNIDLKVMDISI